MHLSDRFLRFAAECEAMAQSSPSAENRVVWRGLAERWIRCAGLVDDKGLPRRRTKPVRRLSDLAESSLH
jgi:hypothetical protein